MNEKGSVVLKHLTDTIKDVATELYDQYVPTETELVLDQMRCEGNYTELGGEMSDEDFAEALVS